LIIGGLVVTDFGAHEAVDTDVADLRRLVNSVADSVGAQIFSIAAIFVVAGDGYSKYRRFTRKDPDAKKSD
jgi:hypothetical protein